MMRYLDDRSHCPHCGARLNPRPYLMSREATENVLPLKAILWLVVIVLVLLIVVR